MRETYIHWLKASIEGELPVYEELYHLASDPNETNNLASRPAYNQVLERMRTECQRMVSSAKGDVMLPPLTLAVAEMKEGKRKGVEAK